MATHATSLRGRRGSENPKNNRTALYSLPTLYRGIYNRVAQKVGCDPSYVSRVARGERKSDAVSRVLESEIRNTLALSSRQMAVLAKNSGSRSARTRA